MTMGFSPQFPLTSVMAALSGSPGERQGHPETELVAEVADMYRRGGALRALRDGPVVVVDGELAEAMLV